MNGLSDQYDSGLIGPREAISAALQQIERMESRIAALEADLTKVNEAGRLTTMGAMQSHHELAARLDALEAKTAGTVLGTNETTLEAAREPAPAPETDTVTISRAQWDRTVADIESAAMQLHAIWSQLSKDEQHERALAPNLQSAIYALVWLTDL